MSTVINLRCSFAPNFAVRAGNKTSQKKPSGCLQTLRSGKVERTTCKHCYRRHLALTRRLHSAIRIIQQRALLARTSYDDPSLHPAFDRDLTTRHATRKDTKKHLSPQGFDRHIPPPATTYDSRKHKEHSTPDTHLKSEPETHLHNGLRRQAPRQIRNLPPRATIYATREAHYIHFRRAICGWGICIQCLACEHQVVE